MRDAVELELAGVPAVVVTHDKFEVAARLMAAALGMPKLALAVVPQPRAAGNKEEEARKADDILAMLPRLLDE